MKDMRKTIRVCGAAWLGMNSTADIIIEVFAFMGYWVNTDIEYQSLIKWGINYFDIFVSDNSSYISQTVDIVLALDAMNLEHSLKNLASGWVVITNSKNIEKLEKKWISFENLKVLSIDIDNKYDNTYLISVLAKYLGLKKEIVDGEIAKIFAKKGEKLVASNQKILHDVLSEYVFPEDIEVQHLESISEPKRVINGNEMLAYWAIAWELEYYSAYPMTPASSVLTEIINEGSVPYLQAEDEISVSMSALGASFAGKRSMVGTSGGGFALMVESISFAQQTEIPLVMILSQRAGPSTGTPTFHEQAEISFALTPSFGDVDHIVIVPSSMENAYYSSAQALNLAWKYQTVVILLSDKQFADGKATIQSELTVPATERGKIEENPTPDYKRYEITEDGISPYTVPGTKDWDFIATSYEHDEYGATSEDSEVKKAMTEKRWRKLENFFEKEGISGYEVFNKDAKKMIITTSYTIYTAQEFIKNNPEYGLIMIHFLKPLDERLLDEIKHKDEIIFVESNYSGQLENYISKEFWLKFIDGLVIKNMRKYDLYPFYYEDFETLLK